MMMVFIRATYCGNKVISDPGNYDIFPVCDWEDDSVQSSDPDFSGVENTLSLLNARKWFLLKTK